MTPSMPFHDLLEMAVLDTLGLLDEQEQAAFEMAFRSAPPAVQAQVRREQTRFAKTISNDANAVCHDILIAICVTICRYDYE
ncbi:hypothetical protein J4558_08100 [Leptolyngbya sp. 15MV]|nr:hypothetical protein J4558_08100 [Leptolyngbya sp. 15MV]